MSSSTLRYSHLFDGASSSVAASSSASSFSEHTRIPSLQPQRYEYTDKSSQQMENDAQGLIDVSSSSSSSTTNTNSSSIVLPNHLHSYLSSLAHHYHRDSRCHTPSEEMIDHTHTNSHRVDFSCSPPPFSSSSSSQQHQHRENDQFLHGSSDESSFFVLSPQPPLSPNRSTGGVDRDDSLMMTPSIEFMRAAPLRIMRQQSFGVDEPMTAMINDEESPSPQPKLVEVNLNQGSELEADEKNSEEILASLGGVTLKSFRSSASSSVAPRGYHQLSQPHKEPCVFHSFLLMILTQFFSTGDLCTSFIRICKQWRKYGHQSLAHPTRRKATYVVVEGGAPILRELKRLTSNELVKRRLEATAQAMKAAMQAKQRAEKISKGIVVGTEIGKSAPSTNQQGQQLLAPSLTLIQHVQFLPVSHAPDASSSSSSARSLFSRMRKMYRNFAASDAHILTNADCLLIATHLSHLRVLRIFDGSKITNDGVKILAMQLKHLRILHIGRLSDLQIDDRALGYISESLVDLHSLWLTQNMSPPQQSLFHPPRTVFNLFTALGVAKLTRLHSSLHHLNLGGHRNITLTGLRLLSCSTPRLQLHTLHLNGWHIIDECITLLASAHSSSLYYLHLFDVGISNASMTTLSQMSLLETLILDHAHEVDHHGLELLVDEAIAQYTKAKAGEEVDEESHGSIDGSTAEAFPRHSASFVSSSSSSHSVRGASLYRLELHSCARLQTHDAILNLAVHPILRQVQVTGQCSIDPTAVQLQHQHHRPPRLLWQTDAKCRRVLDQVEELSQGRIRCNRD